MAEVRDQDPIERFVRGHPVACLAVPLTVCTWLAVLVSVAALPDVGPPGWVDHHHPEPTTATHVLGRSGAVLAALDFVLLWFALRRRPSWRLGAAVAVVGGAGLAALVARFALLYG